MNIHDYSFDLPPELIGQVAIEPRDSCKLLIVDRKSETLSHQIFRDLVNILDDNYVLVLNDTKVFPARLFGEKISGGKVEILLLKQVANDMYQAIGRGKLKQGMQINFSTNFFAEVMSKDDDGEVVLKFNASGAELFAKIDKLGNTPLPPYIHSKTNERKLREQYQTVYAKEKGSAAAPTAGLHFTEELLRLLNNNDVEVERVTLHVGLGTFKPVTDEQIEAKSLHTESFWLTKEVADRLNDAKKHGKKIIAVGTTTCRVLESQSDNSGHLSAGEGETNIFIQPGYKFKFVDGLITNFHLPETSLLMLVSALTSFPNSTIHFANWGDSLMGKAYKEAIDSKYKFFSFGDAMLIL